MDSKVLRKNLRELYDAINAKYKEQKKFKKTYFMFLIKKNLTIIY